jgi:hypothetical protein
MKKIGLLLINLGSPDAPTPKAVGRYLREFLMDEFVIDLPKPLRWLLVNLLIVPRRRYASAKLYQNVWTEDGSPLLVYSHSLATALRGRYRTIRDRSRDALWQSVNCQCARTICARRALNVSSRCRSTRSTPNRVMKLPCVRCEWLRRSRAV